MNAAAHGVGAGRNLSLDGGQPSGSHAGIRIGAGDDANGGAHLLQASAGLVHEQAAGTAHVSFGYRKAQLGHVQYQLGEPARLLAHNCRCGIRAIVSQHDDLKAAQRQFLTVQISLSRQGRQRSGQVFCLVFSWNNHAYLQLCPGRWQLPAQLRRVAPATRGREGWQSL